MLCGAPTGSVSARAAHRLRQPQRAMALWQRPWVPGPLRPTARCARSPAVLRKTPACPRQRTPLRNHSHPPLLRTEPRAVCVWVGHPCLPDAQAGLPPGAVLSRHRAARPPDLPSVSRALPAAPAACLLAFACMHQPLTSTLSATLRAATLCAASLACACQAPRAPRTGARYRQLNATALLMHPAECRGCAPGPRVARSLYHCKTAGRSGGIGRERGWAQAWNALSSRAVTTVGRGRHSASPSALLGPSPTAHTALIALLHPRPPVPVGPHIVIRLARFLSHPWPGRPTPPHGATRRSSFPGAAYHHRHGCRPTSPAPPGAR